MLTLVCQTTPRVGRGGELACARTAAPVVGLADHQRDRRAPPRGARRATLAARRWRPLQGRSASPTRPTLTAPPAPSRCTARANLQPLKWNSTPFHLCFLARPAPAPASCRARSSTAHACGACALRLAHTNAVPAIPSCAGDGTGLKSRNDTPFHLSPVRPPVRLERHHQY